MKISTKPSAGFSSLIATSIIVSLASINLASANAVDEAANACTEAARLITEEDDLDGAIEEASWCMTGLKQLKDEIKLSLLPDELDGFVGGDIKNESVMGMTTTTRVYTRDSDKLTVTLLTTSSEGAGALGGLASLGKLFGAMEGAGAAGGKKVRIQRRTVIASDEGGSGTLTVQLKSGGTLQVESQDLDSDDLIEFMREFPIVELDEAIGE